MADIDGNIYPTITIGSQTWMAKNLNVTKFNDGTPIQLVTSDSSWYNFTTPGYCWYNYNESVNGKVYGAYYNWFAINTGKLAPPGWHVPTASDWEILVNYLGGRLVAGGKLKEVDTIHWQHPNVGATNSSKFCGLPGGFCADGFVESYESGWFWSSSVYNSTFSICRSLVSDYPYCFEYYIQNNSGLSVRCIKN